MPKKPLSNNGNTPTHVGKTRSYPAGSAGHEKHPHARGEDGGATKYGVSLTETPPRTWGRRSTVLYTCAHRGNTPTHVGKTARCPGLLLRQEKHPHARGEDVYLLFVLLFIMETPPRTWGRPNTTELSNKTQRNTPTHVGKTFTFCLFSCSSWKHPHARGEDHDCVSSDTRIVETPPRTWGRPWSALSCKVLVRNTPTHVGKTQRVSQDDRRRQKHPHARGEDYSGLYPKLSAMETPPRTWGRLLLGLGFSFVFGNTPTHVGKTQSFLVIFFSP